MKIRKMIATIDALVVSGLLLLVLTVGVVTTILTTNNGMIVQQAFAKQSHADTKDSVTRNNAIGGSANGIFLDSQSGHHS